MRDVLTVGEVERRRKEDDDLRLLSPSFYRDSIIILFNRIFRHILSA